MKQSSNLGLALYDKTDLMNITGLENSLNHNMELIDSEINQLSLKVGQLCNPNLLDDWDFENPVDQRGGYVVPPGVVAGEIYTAKNPITTDKYYMVKRFEGSAPIFDYNGVEYATDSNTAVRGYTGAGYTIDRWFIHEHGTLLINDDCISIEGMHRQFIENGVEKFCGKRCCFSVLTKDGELFSGHGIVPTNGTNHFYRANNVLLYSYSDGNTLSVLMETHNGKFIQPIAAKLELGDHQTLAHQDADGNWILNEIPNYNEQLLRCSMSKADSSDGFANNYLNPLEVSPYKIGAVSKTGDTMTGSLDVGGMLTVGGHTRYSRAGSKDDWVAACIDAITDNYFARLALFGYNDGRYHPVLQLFKENGEFVKDDTLLHTSNKDLIFTYGTADLTAGSSALGTGMLYFCYE